MSPVSRISNFQIPESAQDRTIHIAAGFIIAMIIVATLYFAREVLIPLTLAGLLSFILSPLIRWMRKARIPRGAAVSLAVTVAVGICVGLGAVISSQLATLADDLPVYERNLKEKIREFRSAQSGDSALERAAAALNELGKEISKEKSEPGADPATQPPLVARPQPPPTQVVLKEPVTTPLKPLEDLIAPLIAPLATAGLTLLFTIFILLQREDLRDRLIRLFGSTDLNRTTVAMNDGATRLSRFFLIQAALNASFGIFVGIALSVIGIPSPVLWGLLAGVMRFVPYIGSIIAAVFPIALAAAIDPGWSIVAWTAAVFIIGEPLMGHIIEPIVYGRHTGLSPLAVVAAATFWTWLWGPIGLILATPLTLCIVVVAQHVERFEFLSVLLGSEPALRPEQSFYQRLLAGDAAEIMQQAEDNLKGSSLVDYYDRVALPGLRLAQHDERSGHLHEERVEEIGETIDELVERLDAASLAKPRDVAEPSKSILEADEPAEAGLARLEAAAVGAAERFDGAPVAAEWRNDGAVLVVPGRGELDAASAQMLVRLLRKAGIGATLRGEGGLSGIASAIDQHDASVLKRVIVSTVGGANLAQARFLVRRVERALPGTRVIVGAWALSDDHEDFHWLRKNSGAAAVVRTFGEVVDGLLKSAREFADGARAAGSTDGPATAEGDARDTSKPLVAAAG